MRIRAFLLAVVVLLPVSRARALDPGRLLFDGGLHLDATIEETASPSTSTSADWWVSSGGRFFTKGGVGRTIHGEVPATDRWRVLYAASSPVDTDGGAHPQSLFRLVSRLSFDSFRQELFFRIRQVHLSASPERNAWSGVLLFHRYGDGDNLYYAGLRVDGAAVLKKKIGGRYFTIAYRRLYEGAYDRASRPNLLPVDRWIGIRTTITDGAEGTLLRLYVRDDTIGNGWVLAVEALDRPGGEDGDPFRSGRAGIRSDFMDVEFSGYEIRSLAADEPEAAPKPLGLFRPSTGEWLFDATRDGRADLTVAFGRAGDRPQAAFREALVLFRPDTGTWLFDEDRNGVADVEIRYGARADSPVPADFDADGRVDLAVFRPSTGTWFVDRDRDGLSDARVRYGSAGDLPVPGDYDGDGFADLAVFRPSTGTWFLDTTLDGRSDRRVRYGAPGDVPVPADYDGDGASDLAVFRPSTGIWYVDWDRDGISDVRLRYGTTGDRPVPADFDGDGREDPAVYRPSTGTWFVDLDRDGASDLRVRHGRAGDVPL